MDGVHSAAQAERGLSLVWVPTDLPAVGNGRWICHQCEAFDRLEQEKDPNGVEDTVSVKTEGFSLSPFETGVKSFRVFPTWSERTHARLASPRRIMDCGDMLSAARA